MRTASQLEYGHCQCPHCEREFNLANSVPTFGESLCGDVLVYVMCSRCHEHYQEADPEGRKVMSNKCFVNAKLHQRDANGNRIPWAVTTALTLFLNGDDLVCAIEEGLNLSEQQYFGILNGECDVLQISSKGVRSIVKGHAHRVFP
jgi:hypothetical protein